METYLLIHRYRRFLFWRRCQSIVMKRPLRPDENVAETVQAIRAEIGPKWTVYYRETEPTTCPCGQPL